MLLAARGTSDHAALYLKYLVEVRLGLPAGLMSPSTFTTYDARPDLRDVLVVALSQSGGSPDLSRSLQAARACGATTMALTNDASSPLADAAELHLDLLAGPEHAVAATKSYVAELVASWLLVDAWSGGDGDAARGLSEERGARAGAQSGDRGARRSLPVHRPRRAHRARVLVPDRARGGAQADGDVLRRSARLLRRRPAARDPSR